MFGLDNNEKYIVSFTVNITDTNGNVMSEAIENVKEIFIDIFKDVSIEIV